jgi:hypothetical protein
MKVWLSEDGDHLFKVLKRLERNELSVWDEIVEIMATWFEQVA